MFKNGTCQYASEDCAVLDDRLECMACKEGYILSHKGCVKECPIYTKEQTVSLDEGLSLDGSAHTEA